MTRATKETLAGRRYLDLQREAKRTDRPTDLYSLMHRHSTEAATLRTSLDRVAQYRRVELTPLLPAFTGYAQLGQQRWLAWLRKNRLESAIPADFAVVLDRVRAFADPVIVADVRDKTWNPVRGEWG